MAASGIFGYLVVGKTHARSCYVLFLLPDRTGTPVHQVSRAPQTCSTPPVGTSQCVLPRPSSRTRLGSLHAPEWP